MRLLVFFLLTFCSLISINCQIDSALITDLQVVLDNSVTSQGNHGASAYVIMEDGQTWSGTSGVNHNENSITETTLFHGASTTKLNIASLLLLLAEDDLIDLDQVWTEYVSLDVEFSPAITVRQLLNHTSGIPDYLETAKSGSDITSDFSHFYTPQEILEDVVGDVPDFLPGTGFKYSNSNYALAAFIIEQVTGNPVHFELRNRIWDPLGMEHTYFGAYESYAEETAGIWWNFGSGLTNYSNESNTSMLSYAYGAGNLVSCPKDLAILLSKILEGELLSEDSLNEMKSFVALSYSSWTAGYGLGLHHYQHDEDRVFGHDGYYTNLTDMFQSTNCGFTLVTMTNTQTSWFGLFTPMYNILAEHCISSKNSEIQEPYFSFYPNPTDGEMRISSDFNIDEIQILDISGKVILHEFPQNSEHVIEFISEGIFFVKIRANGFTFTEKLIAKK